MVTVKQAWIGFVVLLLVTMLIVVFAVYWHHVTGVNTLHLLLAYGPDGDITHGC